MRTSKAILLLNLALLPITESAVASPNPGECRLALDRLYQFHQSGKPRLRVHAFTPFHVAWPVVYIGPEINAPHFDSKILPYSEEFQIDDGSLTARMNGTYPQLLESFRKIHSSGGIQFAYNPNTEMGLVIVGAWRNFENIPSDVLIDYRGRSLSYIHISKVLTFAAAQRGIQILSATKFEVPRGTSSAGLGLEPSWPMLVSTPTQMWPRFLDRSNPQHTFLQEDPFHMNFEIVLRLNR